MAGVGDGEVVRSRVKIVTSGGHGFAGQFWNFEKLGGKSPWMVAYLARCPVLKEKWKT